MFVCFFSSALSALHLYNEPKFMVIGNPVILEQSHAHNAPELWDRGSSYISWVPCYPTSLASSLSFSLSSSFLAFVFSFLSFPFLSLCRLCLCLCLFFLSSPFFCRLCLYLVFCFCFLCSRWNFVDIPLMFFCPPAGHVLDWQPHIVPHIVLGMVEARSVSVKNIHTPTTASDILQND